MVGEEENGMEGRGFGCPSCGKHWVMCVAVFPGLHVFPGLGGSLSLTGVRVLGGTSSSFFLQLWKSHSMACLTPYFSPQNCRVQYMHTKHVLSVCLGMAAAANTWVLLLAQVLLEKFGQIPQVCLSCLHRLSHERMAAQLHGLD